MWPFQDLVERHRPRGEIIAPNANRIIKDLIGHASELGLTELAEVFRDAFDPDVRNAVAHADYIIWPMGCGFGVAGPERFRGRTSRLL
jgi:hypothetical protein